MKLAAISLGILLASGVAHADAAHDILGHWTTGFMTEPQGVFQFRQSYTFDEQTVNVDFDVLINHPLGQGAFRQTYQGTYKVGGPAQHTAGAVDFDLDFAKRLVTPLHPSTVKDYNHDHECGLDGWQIGVPRDTTGLTCASMTDEDGIMDPMYSIVKVLPNESLEFGLIPDDGSQGSDAAHRPTALDDSQLIPRNGHGGTTAPDPVDALIPGFYAVTGHKVNTHGCDVETTPDNRPFTNFEIYANATLIPFMIGWSLETCNGIQQCKDHPNEVLLAADFPIHEAVADGLYRGEVKSTNWTGTCHALVTVANTTRDAHTGAIVIQAKTFEGTVQGVEDADHCGSRDQRIDQQLEHFSCVGAATVTASPLPH